MEFSDREVGCRQEVTGLEGDRGGCDGVGTARHWFERANGLDHADSMH
jgi:hypothetical protein